MKRTLPARLFALTTIAALLPRTALAHEGLVAPDEAWTAWDFDPLVVLLLAVSGWLYARGVRRLWKARTGAGIKRWEAACFVCGWITLVVSLLSPLHPLGGTLFHALQHAAFFFTAVLFWWAAVHGGRAAGYGAAVLYMLTTAMHSGLLGAMLTFARTLWYPSYGETAPTWGLSGLEDQQIGGLIMWVPAGVVYIIAAMALVAGWLRESERRVEQWQSRSQSAEA